MAPTVVVTKRQVKRCLGVRSGRKEEQASCRRSGVHTPQALLLYPMTSLSLHYNYSSRGKPTSTGVWPPLYNYGVPHGNDLPSLRNYGLQVDWSRTMTTAFFQTFYVGKFKFLQNSLSCSLYVPSFSFLTQPLSVSSHLPLPLKCIVNVNTEYILIIMSRTIMQALNGGSHIKKNLM